MAIRQVGASSTRAPFANAQGVPEVTPSEPLPAPAAGEPDLPSASIAGLTPATEPVLPTVEWPDPAAVTPSVQDADLVARTDAETLQAPVDAAHDAPALVDYRAIIAAAVAALPVNSAAARRAVYDHARQVVQERLRASEPPQRSFVIAREELRLERAIRALEAQYAVTNPAAQPAGEPVAAAVVGEDQPVPVAVAVEPPPLAPRPRRTPARAQAMHGVVLRTFGLTAAILGGLLGYWLLAGKTRVVTRTLSPVTSVPGVQAAAEPSLGAAAKGPPQRVAAGDAAGTPPLSDADPSLPRRAPSDLPDDIVSVCQRAVSPAEFLLCSDVGMAPAGSGEAVDQKFPFWVGAYKSVADVTGTASSPADLGSAPSGVAAAHSASPTARGRFEQGLARLKADDLERAVAEFSEAVRADPQFADAYLQRGNALFRNGETEKAIADFNTAIGLDARHASAYKARAMATLYKGDDDAAILDLTRAIQYGELDRTLSAIEMFYARRSRAALYDRKRLYDGELADLNALIDGYWKNAALVAALRATYREQGSVSLMASIYRMRAGVQVKRGDPDAAVSDLTFAMQLDPQRTLPLMLERARVQEAAGRRAQAAADFERVLELSPNNEDAQAGMARLNSRG
ncbi:MAG TPA: tetratricopeptide repeat protein [Xanthobacteraceae bacterium]|nr:tetratricopeptide repeat protein [Xanthobacteraceae bacterium]